MSEVTAPIYFSELGALLNLTKPFKLSQIFDANQSNTGVTNNKKLSTMFNFNPNSNPNSNSNAGGTPVAPAVARMFKRVMFSKFFTMSDSTVAGTVRKWRDVIYAPKAKMFVAISQTASVTDAIAVSSDGVTWTRPVITTTGTSSNIRSITTGSGNRAFVTAGNGTSYSSFDGSTVDSYTPPVTSTDRSCIVYSPSLDLYVIAANSGVYTTRNFMNWGSVTSVDGVFFSALTWNSSLQMFIACVATSAQTYNSTDGVNWTRSITTLPASVVSLNSSSDDSRVVALFPSTSIHYSTTDGLTWDTFNTTEINTTTLAYQKTAKLTEHGGGWITTDSTNGVSIIDPLQPTRNARLTTLGLVKGVATDGYGRVVVSYERTLNPQIAFSTPSIPASLFAHDSFFSVASSTVFDLTSTQNFTYEWFCKLISTPTTVSPAIIINVKTSKLIMRFESLTSLVVAASNTSFSLNCPLINGTNAKGWNFFSVSRSGSTVNVHQNGILIGTSSVGGGFVVASNTGLTVGSGFHGHLCNFHYTRSSLYSTTNYTPPKSEIIPQFGSSLFVPVSSSRPLVDMRYSTGLTLTALYNFVSNDSPFGADESGSLENVWSPTNTPGLQNWYEFDDTSTIYQGNDALLMNGASLSTASPPTGTAFLSLTSSLSQYALVRKVEIPSTTYSYTFAFWFRSSGTASEGRLFEFSPSATSITNSIRAMLSSSGTITVRAYRGTVSNSQALTGAGTGTNDNVWRHFAWVTTGTAASTTGTWTTYINGVLTNTFATQNIIDNTVVRYYNYIGRSPTTGPYLNGGIDDFRMYARALSATEITSLFNKNFTDVSSTGLTLHYTFNTEDAIDNNSVKSMGIDESVPLGPATTPVSCSLAATASINATLNPPNVTGEGALVCTALTKSYAIIPPIVLKPDVRDMTISFFYRGDASGNNTYLFSFTNDANDSIVAFMNTNNLFVNVFNANTSITQTESFSAATANDSTTWNHIAWVMTAGATETTATWRLVANGTDVMATTAIRRFPTVDATYSINYLGQWNGSGWFNGALSDFRVYTRALSTAEITQIRTRSPSDLTSMTGLQLRYTFADATTSSGVGGITTVANKGGYKNHFVCSDLNGNADRSLVMYNPYLAPFTVRPQREALAVPGAGFSLEKTLSTEDQHMFATSSPITTKFTLAFVVTPAETDNLITNLFTSASSSSARSGCVSLSYAADSTRMTTTVAGCLPSVTPESAFTFTQGVSFILVVTGDATDSLPFKSVTCRYNGGAVKDVYQWITNPTDFSGFVLDSFKIGPARVTISKMLLYNNALSEEDILKLEGYLAWTTWGHVAFAPLSNTHTYYSTPPPATNGPVLFRAAPNTIPAATANVKITILGDNFRGVTAVTLGGVAVTSFTVLSATTMRITIPSQQTFGPKVLQVTTSLNGTTSSAPGFVTVYTPNGTTLTASSCLPNGFSLSGGVTTVTGVGFTDLTSVKVLETDVFFNVLNDNSVEVHVPPATAASTASLTFTTNTLTTTTLNNAFVYDPIFEWRACVAPLLGGEAANCNPALADNGTGYLPYTLNGISSTNNIYKTTDYGLVWTQVATISNSAGIRQVVCNQSDGQTLFLCCPGPSVARRSVNGGVTWIDAGTSRTWQRCAMSPNGTRVIASTNGQGVLYSSDSGANFTQSSYTTGFPSAMGLNALGHAIFALPNTGLFYSSNFGVNWAVAASSTPLVWSGCALAESGGYAYATVNSVGGSIYRSTTYGASGWTVIPNTNVGTWGLTISCSQDGQYVVVGNKNGYVYVSKDFGVTFYAMNTPAKQSFNNASVSKNGQWMVVTANGMTYTCRLY